MENKNKSFRIVLSLVLTLFINLTIKAQETFKEDSLLPKVHHAEPLFNDLVRDLGARKGEKEINIGAEFKNNTNNKEYGYLVEYEFAPIDRLGLEVETDFAFYKSTNHESLKKHSLESLRLSGQYSFYVSEKNKTTLAVGYTQIFEFNEFKKLKNDKTILSTTYNPFFIAAKNWKDKYHVLIYTGPRFDQEFATSETLFNWHINTSFHYTLPQGHFIGLEVNQIAHKDKLETTLHPQVKIQLNDDLALGLVAGLPIDNKEESFSSFFRLIYEL